MMNGPLKIVECFGYTKEEAFKDLNFNPDMPAIKGRNATKAWSKAGRPFPGSNAFKQFANQQLLEKTKAEPGVGIYIAVDPPKKDIRRSPYRFVNNKRNGRKVWRLVYWIREDELQINLETGLPEIMKTGQIVECCATKIKATEIMKKLTAKNKKSYSLLSVKIPDVNQISAHSVYTPSANAKKGRFIAVGIEKQ